MTSTGTQISDMTVTASPLPAGAFTPIIATDSATGLNTTYNYRYDLGTDLLTRVSYAALAASGGSALVGYLPASGTATTVQAKLRQIVSAADYGFATGGTGAANATALAAAISGLSSGGIVNIGPGTFTLNTVTIPSDITIQGAGMDSTIIVQGTLTAASYGVLYANSGSSSAYIENLTIRDLTVKCTAGTFSQFNHLISMNGVRNLLVARVKFQAFQGDGLYLGSGVNGTDERHNLNATVRDCVFDGVNNENRNGISVIDGDGVLIDHCTFKNCTKSTQPGPIDIEPDANAFAIIKNITIRNCSFNLCGGSIAEIAMYIPSAVTALPRHINIEDNDFRAYAGSGSEIYIDVQRTLTAADESMAVNISGNQGKSGYVPINLLACKGVTVTDTNTFQDYGAPCNIGFNGSTDKAWDVIWQPNLIRCGTNVVAASAAVFVGKVDGLDIGGIIYKGGPAAADGYPLRFIGSVTSNNVHILPSARFTLNTSQVVSIFSTSHTFTGANNRLSPEANLGGGTVAFTATAPGQRLAPATLTWDPGSLIDGAGETSSAVTVTGAAFGDIVTCSAPYDLVGILLTGYVSAADAVKMRLQNESTATVDLASGSYVVTVTKKPVF